MKHQSLIIVVGISVFVVFALMVSEGVVEASEMDGFGSKMKGFGPEMKGVGSNEVGSEPGKKRDCGNFGRATTAAAAAGSAAQRAAQRARQKNAEARKRKDFL